uniref:GTP-binding protein n=1 Tax=Timema genevievae TaxID=629358 RepID=A0A7R9PI20_TIMGE|nr:unnamed protein product [Timema genevievae]
MQGFVVAQESISFRRKRIDSLRQSRDVPREQSVSIMLNGEESELWFINVANPKMEMDRVSPPDAFVVMYSVIDKASFQRAEDELARLQDWGLMRSRPAILVGNKVDLARSRAISTQDGKCLACTYRAKFIEISVGISHNIDELLVGILNQIRLKLANAERETSAHWYRSRGVPESESVLFTNSDATQNSPGIIALAKRKGIKRSDSSGTINTQNRLALNHLCSYVDHSLVELANKFQSIPLTCGLVHNSIAKGETCFGNMIDEFLDVIYWSRQALGIIIGLLWGLIPLKGFVALLLFAVVNAGLIYLYFSNFQSVDEEEFGGPWELTKEGFMTSFAGFLVTWIIIYSVLCPFYSSPMASLVLTDSSELTSDSQNLEEECIIPRYVLNSACFKNCFIIDAVSCPHLYGTMGSQSP